MSKILFLLALLATQAWAQQPAPSSPEVMIYRQLLDAANAQLVTAVVQLQQAQARIKDLEEKEKKDNGVK